MDAYRKIGEFFERLTCLGIHDPDGGSGRSRNRYSRYAAAIERPCQEAVGKLLFRQIRIQLLTATVNEVQP